MTTERDPGTRIVLSWLREETHENAERVLLRALDEVDTTPQRRSWWPAWRTSPMNTYAKLIAAAAAVLVVAAVGYQFLPRSGGIGGQPTIAPSPSPTLLALGTFRAKGAAVVLDATGGASSVSGSMIVSSHETNGRFTVDLECTRTTDAGLIWIGGDVTESANFSDAPKGTRAAIVLKRGTPVQAVFVFQMDDPRSASCQAFFDDMSAIGNSTITSGKNTGQKTCDV